MSRYVTFDLPALAGFHSRSTVKHGTPDGIHRIWLHDSPEGAMIQLWFDGAHYLLDMPYQEAFRRLCRCSVIPAFILDIWSEQATWGTFYASERDAYKEWAVSAG